MKWYKHDTKTHTDEKIRDLVLQFGQEGYGVYITCLELIAEKIDLHQIPKISISDRVLREICRVSHHKLTKILSFFSQNSLIFSIFHDGYWNLECPNLLKRLDNWTKHSQVTTKQPSTQQEEEVKNKKKECKNIKNKAFVVPTEQEVEERFKELNASQEAKSFYDHFMANGWRVGRGGIPMKSWEHAASNWVGNAKKFETTAYGQPKFMDKAARQLQLEEEYRAKY